MPKVIHFEIPAEDPKRAVTFYKEAFDWKFENYEGTDYWLAKTGEDKEPGINCAISEKEAFHLTTINTVNVSSFEKAVEKIRAAGGQILGPKMTVPNVGYMAYCKDTEGNMFGIMQMDPKAK